MRQLFFLTRADEGPRDEYKQFWGLEPTRSSELSFRVFNPLGNSQVVVIRQKARTPLEKDLKGYSGFITSLIESATSAIGILFHRRDGDAIASKFDHCFDSYKRGKIAFCQWYSSNASELWSEKEIAASLPYNNLMRSWTTNDGNEKETFEIVWNYFTGDTILEDLLVPFVTKSPFTNPNELVGGSNQNGDSRTVADAKKHLLDYLKRDKVW